MLPRRAGCFAGLVLWSRSMHGQSVAIYTYTQLQVPRTQKSLLFFFFFCMRQKRVIQQQVLRDLPTQPKSCPAAATAWLHSRAPGPPAPVDTTNSTHDYFSSSKSTSAPPKIPQSLGLGAQFKVGIKQLSAEVKQNYPDFHSRRSGPTLLRTLDLFPESCQLVEIQLLLQ